MRRAFTLIETLLSFTLLSLVMVLLLNLFPSSMAGVRAGEQHFQANLVAGSIMDQQLSQPFNQLTVGLSQTLASVTYSQVDYHPLVEVLAAGGGDPKFLRALRVTVSWKVRGQLHQVVHEQWIYRLAYQL